MMVVLNFELAYVTGEENQKQKQKPGSYATVLKTQSHFALAHFQAAFAYDGPSQISWNTSRSNTGDIPSPNNVCNPYYTSTSREIT